MGKTCRNNTRTCSSLDVLKASTNKMIRANRRNQMSLADENTVSLWKPNVSSVIHRYREFAHDSNEKAMNKRVKRRGNKNAFAGHNRSKQELYK